jgi:hypothetical protein
MLAGVYIWVIEIFRTENAVRGDGQQRGVLPVFSVRVP